MKTVVIQTTILLSMVTGYFCNDFSKWAVIAKVLI